MSGATTQGGESSRWQRLKGHIADLAELGPAERGAALRSLVVADEDRSWLQQLAAKLDSADERLSPAARVATTAGSALLRWQAGTTVGGYIIDGFLGRGGMGEVYAAHSVDRGEAVALKVLRQGLEHRGYGHFSLNEQRALQRLDDPHIARFIDAFSVEAMGLCLVMEQVEGEPVDAWCQTHKLSTDARLGLFVEICQAAASAHLHLVVHRDLKPGNVLVTADGSVKLLDFGVAKLLDEDGSNTQTHGGLYTLEFAAPEQVLRQPVSVATDIYALGVMLYRLLTGASPYLTAPSESLIKAVLTDQPRPLAAAGALAESGTMLALDHDLDRVIARAMEKDPRDRYRSAMELAADVQAIRDGAPILGGGGRGYRLVKFVRRHPAGVSMSAALLFLLVLATVVSVHWAQRAEANAQVAAAESKRAGAVSTFLVGLFQDSNPGVNRGDQLTANQILDRGSARLERTLADQPEQRARLQVVVGDVYIAMGEYGRARAALESALKSMRDSPLARSLETVHAIRMLAHVAHRQSALQEALAHIRDAEAVMKEMRPDALEEPIQLALIRCRVNSDLGKFADAARALEQANQLALRMAPGNIGLDADIHAAYADLADETGDFAVAKSHYQAALADYRQALGADHYKTVAVATNLAALLVTKFQDYDQAQPLLETALAQWRQLRGSDSAAYASTANTLGELFRHRQLHERAALLFADSERAYRAALGDRHPSITWPITNHGKSLADQGRYAEALAEHERALAIAIQGQPDTLMQVALIRKLIVDTLIPMGRNAEALKLAEPLLATYREHLDADHPQIVNTLYQIGFARYASGDRAGAEVAWAEALKGAETAFAHLPEALAETRFEIGHPDAVLAEYASRAKPH